MLGETFYDNSVLAWLIAVGIAVATAVTLVVLRTQAVRWLTGRVAGRHPQRVALALAALQGTQPWFLVVVALFVGAQFVALPPKADRLDVTVVLALTRRLRLPAVNAPATNGLSAGGSRARACVPWFPIFRAVPWIRSISLRAAGAAVRSPPSAAARSLRD